MPEPILGTEVLIQFYKGGSYVNYACAINLEVDFEMETKQTKTVGDGVWKRKRGQSLDYRINLDGVVMFSELSPVAFDLLEYFRNMTDVQYRIIFENSEGLKVIEGYALPVNVNLSGGSEGHANGTITLEGNGEPDIRDAMSACTAEIDDLTYFVTGGGVHQIRIGSLVPDSPVITRYDYQLDGAGTQSVFTSGALPYSFGFPFSFSLAPVGSSHTILVTPICENGFSGATFTLNFTKL